jgi:hypothetical protein
MYDHIYMTFNWYVQDSEEGIGNQQGKPHLGFRSLAGDVAGPLRLRWPWGIGGVADHGLSPGEGFSFFVMLFSVSSLGW